jgi:hypothetical protein
MGYIATGLSEGEYREQLLALRVREVLAAEKSVPKKTFWRDVGYIVSAAVPVLTFLGFREYFSYRARKKRKK